MNELLKVLTVNGGELHVIPTNIDLTVTGMKFTATVPNGENKISRSWTVHSKELLLTLDRSVVDHEANITARLFTEELRK